jgi:arylformamidase
MADARRDLVTRRSIIKQGVAGALAATLGPLAFGDELEKKPLVWRDMDQQQLNDAYTQSGYTPNIGQIVARWRSWSAEVRERVGQPLRFAYGQGEIESLQVFKCKRPSAPIHIHIHGGAWQQGTADTYGFPAEMFLDSGVHYVVPDFSWVQDVGGDLTLLANQLRRALHWVYRNAGRFDGDANRIYLSGHSSGGHLAGVMLTTDWQKDYRLPADLIKGGICCSGMFDLEPVRLSHRGDYISFTDEMEHALSPIRHLEKLHTPLIVVYGSYETPEFQRQSRDFVSEVAKAGKPVKLLVANNYNHFEIMETLANPYGILGRAAIEQIQAKK